MQRERDLNAKLEAYETSASTKCGLSGTDAKVVMTYYVAAAAVGLAMTTATEAQIIYSGIQNVNVSGNGTHVAFIDIDGNSNRFRIKEHFDSAFFGLSVAGATVTPLAGGAAVLANDFGGLKRLASGVNISAGAGVFGVGDHTLRYRRVGALGGSTQHGSWAENQSGFAGVRFNGGTATQFGWIRLKWNSNGGGMPDSITAIDWAYNSVANQSIFAGAVPEPAAAAVVAAALAAGWAGVVAWRRANRR